jgi:hypothetical protein
MTCAPLTRRALGWLIDGLIMAVLLLLIFVVLGVLFPESESDPDGGVSGLLGFLALIAVPSIYPVPFDAGSGQTPGRKIAGSEWRTSTADRSSDPLRLGAERAIDSVPSSRSVSDSFGLPSLLAAPGTTP